MNIFYLSRNPAECAREHCDKHVVEMINEYAQLLSSAHRVLDGESMTVRKPGTGRNKKLLVLQGEIVSSDGVIENPVVYRLSHINHPCAVWARQTSGNYDYLLGLFEALLEEYRYRYGRNHATGRFLDVLRNHPKSIVDGAFSIPPLTMPDKYQSDDAIQSYRDLYVGVKSRFARWTKRQPPAWYCERVSFSESNIKGPS